MTPLNSELRLRAFSSPCHISVTSEDGRGEELLALAKSEIDRLESKFSASFPNSLIEQVNRHAGEAKKISLDKEAYSLFNFANALWQQSNHQFDPTLTSLRHCYGETKPISAYKSRITTLLPNVGWSKLKLTPQDVLLPDPGMLIDLNSCVRPYAADNIRRIFLEQGVNSALINLGDDIATIGKQTDGANWLVGVTHAKSSGMAITRLKLKHSGYAIRGDYKRALTIDDERFGRMLSPVDGQPIPGLLCVGVMTDSCLAASGAASVARVKTEQTALRWLEKLGLPWFAIGRDLQCYGLLSQRK